MKTLDEILEDFNKKPKTPKDWANKLWSDLSFCFSFRVKELWTDLCVFFRNLRKYWKILREDNDFDHGYFESLIVNKLTWMADYFKTARIVVDEERIYHQVNLALRLAKIAFEDQSPGENKTPPYLNTKNWRRFLGKTWEKLAKDNLSQSYQYFLEELRKEKARSIFFRYISRYGQTWWD